MFRVIGWYFKGLVFQVLGLEFWVWVSRFGFGF
jgi:hypothetical protein